MPKKKRVPIIVVMLLFVVINLLLSASVSAASSQLINRVQTSSKVVALTFDDGSDGGNVNEILSILKKNNIKATFFMTGSATKSHPSLMKNVVSQGHDIGNHSNDHPDFTKLSAAQMKDQLSKTETIVKNATGKTTKPFFRPPYGYVNAAVLKAVGDAGYTKTIMWTIDTVDWRGDSATTMTNKVVNNIVPGAIILMHNGSGTNTTKALPNMISKLKAKGYQFVTVSQLLTYGSKTTGASYTVKAGDTLYSIARKHNVTVAQLASANKLTNVNLIRVGQVLIIPGKTPSTPTQPEPPKTQIKYTVKAGDTLYGIARKYNITVAQLASANKLTNVNLIRVGQVLTIPGKTTSSQPTSPKKTSYTVKAGDTLYSIARKYKTTVAKIASKNGIKNNNLIRVGQVLSIPQ